MAITTNVQAAQQKSRTTTDNSTVVATEEWGVIMDLDSANYGQQTFEKMSDGNIITSGNWHYQGVDCPFQNATVIMTDKVFTFNATGTAINPNVPSPYNVSTFTLNVTASAHNGISYSTWSISFSTQGWPPNVQGIAYATRKNGSGVTSDDNNHISVVATEVWGVIIDNDSTNYGQETYHKRSDGSIITSGDWHYQGVTCLYQNALVTVIDSTMSFTANGIATNPNASALYRTSPFTLSVTGDARNGKSKATWSIVFSTQGWPPSLQGVSYATRKSGSGVTADDSAKAYDFTVDGIFYEITSSISPYTVAVAVGDTGNSYSGDVTIPSSVTFNSKSYSVTSIGSFAFVASTGLNSVTIPSSVTSIQSWAFLSCSALTAPTIPSSVTLLGDGAFGGCTSITSITIPTSVDSIGKYIFCGCSHLTDIHVDAANTTFSSEDGVLYNKDKTTLLAYPAGKPATSYTISSSVDTIGGYAFGYCKGLTSIIIPSSVTYITGAAFCECTGLTSMTIPSSVTFLNNNPFYGCTGLTAIYVDPANLYNASMDGVLYSKNLHTIICYPPSKSGSSFVIPSSVTYIRSGAFRGCTGLKTVSIPSSVTMIRSEVFSGCTGLTSLYAYPTTPVDLSSALETSNDVFLGVDTMNCVLHVPDGSKDLYAAAVQWKAFVNIVEDANAGVNNPSLSGVKVSVLNGLLQISGATVGEAITVYSLQGATLYSQKADAATVTINLPVHGAYMVKVGTESVKVVY